MQEYNNKIIAILVTCILSVITVLFLNLTVTYVYKIYTSEVHSNIWCYKDWTCDPLNTTNPTPKYLEYKTFLDECNDPNGEQISINPETGQKCSCTTGATNCINKNKACFIVQSKTGEIDLSDCYVGASNALFSAQNNAYFSS